MDQRPQHKSNDTEPHRRKMGGTLEHIGTGDHFVNRTPEAQTFREKNSK